MRIEERLRQSAARHDARPAIVAGRARHSYAEFDLKSERLGAALRSGGLMPGGRVAMFMDDGWEAAVSSFAVLKAGGVLVPIGAVAAVGGLSEVLHKSRPVAVITQSRLAASVATAIANVASVRLIVLAGGDRAPAGSTCISFEEAVGRIGRVPPLAAAGTTDDPAILFGDDAPLTHRELAADAAAAAVPGDGIVLPPLAERAGFGRLVAAIDAGRTMVAEPLFAQEDNRRRHGAVTRPGESRFGVLDLLDKTIAGGSPACSEVNEIAGAAIGMRSAYRA